MPTPSFKELVDQGARRRMALPGAALPKLRPLKVAPASPLAVAAKISQPAELRAAHRTELPSAPRPDEPKLLSTCYENPVLNEQGAAFVLGVSADLLKKWRQRKQGPDYIQCGPGGPVRYEIEALLAFRDFHKNYLNSKR